MFSSLARQLQPSPPPRRAHDGRLGSPEASPSPGPANRAYAQRRHATADFTEADDDDDISQDGDGGDPFQTEPVDEDGPNRLPILPLFSASYLGKVMGRLHPRHAYSDETPLSLLLIEPVRFLRYAPDLYHHPCDPHPNPDANRDEPLLGPATLASSLPVPHQADAAADTRASFLTGHVIRPHGELSAVQ